MKHETSSARCRVSRSVKQSRGHIFSRTGSRNEYTCSCVEGEMSLLRAVS